MVAFLSGDGRKEWATFRSRDSTCLPAIISINHATISLFRLFSAFVFSVGLRKRQAEQSGLGAELLVAMECRCVHATSADFHVAVVSGCPYILCRVWFACCCTPALPVLNNHVPCVHKVVTTCCLQHKHNIRQISAKRTEPLTLL